jgi:hypothetical protein
MKQVECVEATGFVHKLRGGSQPALVQANDGFSYVVKFQNNFQGPNLLFNEAIGTEIFTLAGLPCPEWRTVAVSERFLARNPECWLESEHGLVKPQPGLCFGSRFLEWNDTRVLEILAGGYFSRVRNRQNFWTAWVLDVLCEHTDNRQALFVQDETRWLDAFFIDHGHLLGGARGAGTPFYRASRYIDPRIYSAASGADADGVERLVRGIDPLALAETVWQLPAGWKTATALLRFGRLMARLGDPALVRSTTQFVLGLTERIRAEARGKNHELRRTYFRFPCDGAGVCAEVSSSAGNAWVARGGCDPLCRSGSRGPQAVCPPILKAANF